MPGYLIACVSWHDAKAAETYGKLAVESLRPFGGKYLMRGAPVTVLEGASPPQRLAIIEFPSADAVREWHESKEYAPVRAIRHEKATTHWIVVMEGVAQPG